MRIGTIILSFLFVASAHAATDPGLKSEELYFSLELRRAGKLWGKPKLLGEMGKVVKARRQSPGAHTPDYLLVLKPVARGEGFHVLLDVSLGGLEGHGEFDLSHAQPGTFELGKLPGDLQISVTLMRVDSPEFRALMEEAVAEEPPSSYSL
jgi:hypothetical protein